MTTSDPDEIPAPLRPAAEPTGSGGADRLHAAAWERVRRPATRAVVVAGAAVAGAGLVVELVHAGSHAPAVEAAVELLSLSYEANVPTWYASSLLLTCALLLAVIAADVGARGGPHRARWIGLAIGFAVMSLDEAVQLHEHLGGLVGAGGLLYFDWVIPAAAVIAVLGAVYVPLLRDLPARRRRQVVVAAALYLGGAVAMELPLGWWTERAGGDNAVYALIDWTEETLELAGASVFALALAERWVDRAEASP